MNIVSLLHDTHVLILMDDKKAKNTLKRLFESMGATVHTAQSQNEAIGLYWRLFRAGIRPRVVVTSWSLTPTDSKEYQYLEMLGRAETDGTALNFLVNVMDLDPTAFLTVYTKDPEQAKEVLSKAHLKAEVFGRPETDPTAFVARIATHHGISSQRTDCNEVCQTLQAREEMRRQNNLSSVDAGAPAFG